MMKSKVSFLITVFAACLMGTGSASVQAGDKYDRRDPIRSMRTGARDLLTLTQGAVYLDGKPKDAQVFVDDRYYGVVQDFNKKEHPLFLFPGRHRIELRHPKYYSYQMPVELRPHQDIRLKFKMQKY